MDLRGRRRGRAPRREHGLYGGERSRGHGPGRGAPCRRLLGPRSARGSRSSSGGRFEARRRARALARKSSRSLLPGAYQGPCERPRRVRADAGEALALAGSLGSTRSAHRRYGSSAPPSWSSARTSPASRSSRRASRSPVRSARPRRSAPTPRSPPARHRGQFTRSVVFFEEALRLSERYGSRLSGACWQACWPSSASARADGTRRSRPRTRSSRSARRALPHLACPADTWADQAFPGRRSRDRRRRRQHRGGEIVRGCERAVRRARASTADARARGTHGRSSSGTR